MKGPSHTIETALFNVPHIIIPLPLLLDYSIYSISLTLPKAKNYLISAKKHLYFCKRLHTFGYHLTAL